MTTMAAPAMTQGFAAPGMAAMTAPMTMSAPVGMGTGSFVAAPMTTMAAPMAMAAPMTSMAVPLTTTAAPLDVGGITQQQGAQGEWIHHHHHGHHHHANH